MNGFIGKLIAAYLKSKIPDCQPLVVPCMTPERDGWKWQAAVPNLNQPGQLCFAILNPGSGELIKDFCNGLLGRAGYNA